MDLPCETVKLKLALIYNKYEKIHASGRAVDSTYLDRLRYVRLGEARAIGYKDARSHAPLHRVDQTITDLRTEIAVDGAKLTELAPERLEVVLLTLVEDILITDCHLEISAGLLIQHRCQRWRSSRDNRLIGHHT
jgi:hypothetical protein